MDYKAIEAALAKCSDRLRDFRDSASESRDAENYFVNVSCRRLVTEHIDNILRIVRAMAWMEEHKAELVMWGDKWVCQGIGWEDVPYTGPTIIDAIEAAMQQTQ